MARVRGRRPDELELTAATISQPFALPKASQHNWIHESMIQSHPRFASPSLPTAYFSANEHRYHGLSNLRW
jgi:hypothetical protein